ncbi:MAG: MmcQ/YjbR family DNA-binding protein [bacterium]
MATWAEVVAIALRYPGVEKAISYGEPSLKLKKSLISRWRVSDNSIVLLDVDHFERDYLLENQSDIYFLEPHYVPHQIVLANLARIPKVMIEMYIERRWRNVAPKRVLSDWDAR